MFKDIVIGQFIPADSFIHKLDARIKIILTFLFIIVLFVITTLPGYLIATVFVLELCNFNTSISFFFLAILNFLKYVCCYHINTTFHNSSKFFF